MPGSSGAPSPPPHSPAAAHCSAAASRLGASAAAAAAAARAAVAARAQERPRVVAHEEGAVAQWMVAVGDTFKEGDVLYECETEKARTEVEATRSGKLVEIVVELTGFKAEIDARKWVVAECRHTMDGKGGLMTDLTLEGLA